MHSKLMIKTFTVEIFVVDTFLSFSQAASLLKNLKESLYFIDSRHLLNFTAVNNLDAAVRTSLRKTGLAYFLYLFFFSGLEFTLTFVTHSRFNYDRYEVFSLEKSFFMKLIQ